MNIKITGLDKLQRHLADIQNRFSKLNGSHDLAEILTPEFIQQCSRFQSMEELFESSGFEIRNTEDLKNVPDEQWDTFIRGNTKYLSWEKLLQDGSQMWLSKKMTTMR